MTMADAIATAALCSAAPFATAAPFLARLAKTIPTSEHKVNETACECHLPEAWEAHPFVFFYDCVILIY